MAHFKLLFKLTFYFYRKYSTHSDYDLIVVNNILIFLIKRYQRDYLIYYIIMKRKERSYNKIIYIY